MPVSSPSLTGSSREVFADQCSGVIETPMVMTLPGPMTEGIEQLLKNNQALGRRAQPVEIARLIGFLLSEESSFITGAVYVADGGQVC